MENGSIRDSVSELIDDCLWASSLSDIVSPQGNSRGGLALERCVVCTMQSGYCIHTAKRVGGALSITQMKEIEEQEHMRMMQRLRGSATVEEEIDDMFDVLSVVKEEKVESKKDEKDININEMRWKPMEIQLLDKIDSHKVSLSIPSPRGWHTCVNLNNRYLVLFGGLSLRF